MIALNLGWKRRKKIHQGLQSKNSNGKEKKMYSKILVPLDGSELAECVLPHVEALVGGCQVEEVLVIRVVEPFRQPSSPEYAMRPEEIARIDAQARAEVQSYLNLVEGK